MKTTKTTTFLIGILFSALLTTAFLVGCGGVKVEEKKDSTVTDTIVKDSLIIDSIK